MHAPSPVASRLTGYLLVGALLASLATTGHAHEYWLTPSRFRAGAGDTVETRAWVGTGFRGETRPFSAVRARRFVARGPREVDLLPAAVEGAPIFARFRPADDRGLLVAYESNFASIVLAAAEFDRYLALEGLDGPLRARRAHADTTRGRERYARCAKTWIAGSAEERIIAPLGLTFELVPLADPSRSDSVRVRALFRGQPLAGVLLRAWRQPMASPVATPIDAAVRDSVGPSAEARTDSEGLATLVLHADGEWLVSGVHMLPAGESPVESSKPASKDDPEWEPPPPADWESYWASLTFARFRGAVPRPERP